MKSVFLESERLVEHRVNEASVRQTVEESQMFKIPVVRVLKLVLNLIYI